MRKLILMLAVFLYVDKPVASLQFDATINGTITPVASINKQVTTAVLGSSGKTRVLLYGLNQNVFEGHFAVLAGSISNISNVSGSSVDGKAVQITIKTLSQPKDVRVERPQ